MKTYLIVTHPAGAPYYNGEMPDGRWQNARKRKGSDEEVLPRATERTLPPGTRVAGEIETKNNQTLIPSPIIDGVQRRGYVVVERNGVQYCETENAAEPTLAERVAELERRVAELESR